jgi:hypothetical protein
MGEAISNLNETTLGVRKCRVQRNRLNDITWTKLADPKLGKLDRVKGKK